MAIVRDVSNLRAAKIHFAHLSERTMRMGTVFPTILLRACTWSPVIVALVKKFIGGVMNSFVLGIGQIKTGAKGAGSVRISVIFQVAFVGALDC
jgi:hypothetical protein